VDRAATAAELAGLACLVVAGFLAGLVVGFVVAGVVLLVIGYRLELEGAAHDDDEEPS
jgi:hypothetical protein